MSHALNLIYVSARLVILSLCFVSWFMIHSEVRATDLCNLRVRYLTALCVRMLHAMRWESTVLKRKSSREWNTHLSFHLHAFLLLLC